MQIKTIRYYYTSIRWPKSRTRIIASAGEDVEQQKLSFIAGGNAKWHSHFGRLFGGFWYTLTISFRNWALWDLPKQAENLCSHKNLHMDIYRSFVHNCQNVEATKMPFSRWMGKQWYTQTMVYSVLLKRNKLTSHEKAWKNLKCILLSKRTQFDKATYCMIPTTELPEVPEFPELE